MLPTLINPFTKEMYPTIDSDGTYYDHSGGMFYYWDLAPAYYETEESGQTVKKYIQGVRERFYIPSEAINNSPEYNEYFIDYAYYNKTYQYTVPSGDVYLWFEHRSKLNDGQYLRLFQTSEKPSVSTYWIKLTRNGNVMQVSQMVDGINLVLRDGNDFRVLNAANFSNQENFGINYDITINSTVITGAYVLYRSTWNEHLNNTIRDAREEGRQEGLREANTPLTAFDYMIQTGNAVGSFFSMEIFPNVTLGTIAVLPIIAALIVGMVKLLRH